MPEITPMKLQSDLVMRGGIASGIVYPRAIAKLAENCDFRSIGGTSVGAIAAAGTAAAALGAKSGQDHFQTRLKQLPGELSETRDGKPVLERLFQPQPGTRRLFRVLMAGLRHENKVLKVGRIGPFASCPLYPQQRTFVSARGMSEKCQKQTSLSRAYPVFTWPDRHASGTLQNVAFSEPTIRLLQANTPEAGQVKPFKSKLSR